MKINELEASTGMDRATIRYYEKEALISPVRLENSYRDYSPADREQLLKIKLLRQLDMPLEQIKSIQQGSETLSDALTAQLALMDSRMRSMERSRKVCAELQSAGISYDELDAGQYLQKLSEPERREEPPAAYHEPAVKHPYHPIRRYVARLLDYWLIRSALQVLFVVILRLRPYPDWLSILVSFGTPFLAVPLMAAMLHFWGTTPGKWLMGLRITSTEEGKNLTFYEARQREWQVLHHGMGFGIPIWELWRQCKSYQEYGYGRGMDWDAECDYSYLDWKVRKKSAFAAVCLILAVLNVISALDIIKPKHRSDELTLAQYAENYNYYLTLTDGTTKMRADGRWYPEESQSGGTTVIILFAEPERENATFDFETEGESITRISYYNSWTVSMPFAPMSSQMVNAALTALMSQPGVEIWDCLQFLQDWVEIGNDPAGSVRCRNIEVNWEIQSENCSRSGGYYYPQTDGGKVSMTFEILIH